MKVNKITKKKCYVGVALILGLMAVLGLLFGKRLTGQAHVKNVEDANADYTVMLNRLDDIEKSLEKTEEIIEEIKTDEDDAEGANGDE